LASNFLKRKIFIKEQYIVDNDLCIVSPRFINTTATIIANLLRVEFAIVTLATFCADAVFQQTRVAKSAHGAITSQELGVS